MRPAPACPFRCGPKSRAAARLPRFNRTPKLRIKGAIEPVREV
jgi:hypothetical protein